MAFYKDVPEKKKIKINYSEKGDWEEEGSRYNGYHSSDRNNRGNKSHTGFNNYREENRGFRASRNEYTERKFGENKNSFEHKSYERKSYDKKNFDKKTSDRKPFDRSSSFVKHSDAERSFFRSNRPNTELSSASRNQINEDNSYRSFEYKNPEAEFSVREENMAADNILCGRNPIREALKSGRDIEKLLVQKGELSGSAREIVQDAKAAHIAVQVIDKVRMDEIAQHHQGLIAYASAYQYSTLDDILATAKDREESPFVILLDGITDPHNLGAIIRTAECVGAHGVIVPQRRSVGLTPAAVKASAGAVEHVKVARVVNINRTIDELKEKNVWTYAVDMDGSDYLDVDFDGGVALVIGAEGEGISRLTQEHCDTVVSLPMVGQLDSLNASVAAGIMMYRVLACRKK